MTQLIGFIAGLFTTSALVPQVFKAFKTKKVNDLSWGLAIFYFIGVSLWFTYGILVNDNVIVISNFCSLLLNAALIFAKIKYKNND